MPTAPAQTRGVALVTGAASGFGLLTCLDLARAELHVRSTFDVAAPDVTNVAGAE
ncbi:MAG: hypothetical protein AMXMBFR64_12920 [Myxococcales bacterium]